MSALDWYGVGALALILLVFYSIRKILVYVALCGTIVVGVALATRGLADSERLSEWIVMMAGLLLCIFGLLIVRVMLVRSVSLRLLGTLEAGGQQSVGEDVGGRLNDMRSFQLIHAIQGGNALTAFGRLVSGGVAIFYWLFRIKT
jgi:hypothetical protein